MSMPSRKYSPSSETLRGTTVTSCSWAYPCGRHAVLSVTIWIAILDSFSACAFVPLAETAGLATWPCKGKASSPVQTLHCFVDDDDRHGLGSRMTPDTRTQLSEDLSLIHISEPTRP